MVETRSSDRVLRSRNSHPVDININGYHKKKGKAIHSKKKINNKVGITKGNRKGHVVVKAGGTKAKVGYKKQKKFKDTIVSEKNTFSTETNTTMKSPPTNHTASQSFSQKRSIEKLCTDTSSYSSSFSSNNPSIKPQTPSVDSTPLERGKNRKMNKLEMSNEKSVHNQFFDSRNKDENDNSCNNQDLVRTQSSNHQSPASKHNKHPREEENYVHVLERNVKNRYYNRYQCKRCSFIFEGNADLIQRHITGIRKSEKSSNRGLVKCPNPDPEAYAKYFTHGCNYPPKKLSSPKKLSKGTNRGSESNSHQSADEISSSTCKFSKHPVSMQNPQAHAVNVALRYLFS